MADSILDLGEEEKKRIVDTWKIVAQDLKGNGIKFFIHLFTVDPELQKMFQSFAHVPINELAQNRKFKAHAFTVMSSLNGFIDNLDDPELLTQLLEKAGQNHAKHGVKPRVFLGLQNVLLTFLEQELDTQFTPTVKIAWIKFLTFMVTLIDTEIQALT